jgi:hypothetical protein
MAGWTDIAEPPDVPSHHVDGSVSGVTHSDVVTALMDLHDAADDGHDFGLAASAPLPPAVPDVMELLQTSASEVNLRGGRGTLAQQGRP